MKTDRTHVVVVVERNPLLFYSERGILYYATPREESFTILLHLGGMATGMEWTKTEELAALWSAANDGAVLGEAGYRALHMYVYIYIYTYVYIYIYI